MQLVADNLQITSPRIAAALRERDPEPIRVMVRWMEALGADAIDINSGPLSKNPEESMTFLVRTVQSETTLPLLLDTTNPAAMAAGLSTSRNRPVTVNGISLDPERLKQILPLVRDHEADVVCFLLNSDHTVPATVTDRLSAAVELFGRVTDAGIAPERLIIDPVVAPLIWADGKARNLELIDVIRQLPELLGFPVRTLAGLSNLTTGLTVSNEILKEKRLLESVFASMLVGAGLSMALINVGHTETMAAVKAARVLRLPGPFAWGQTGL
jgi:5-methyltetrahydrofolate corrinoid/iron sulfur protein methyltransferase